MEKDPEERLDGRRRRLSNLGDGQISGYGGMNRAAPGSSNRRRRRIAKSRQLRGNWLYHLRERRGSLGT